MLIARKTCFTECHVGLLMLTDDAFQGSQDDRSGAKAHGGRRGDATGHVREHEGPIFIANLLSPQQLTVFFVPTGRIQKSRKSLG
jgi:hypothetical protein